MAQPQNDYWFLERYYDHNALRKSINSLDVKHKYIYTFPNFLLPLAIDEVSCKRTTNAYIEKLTKTYGKKTADLHIKELEKKYGDLDFGVYIENLKKEFLEVRNHQLTELEITVIKKQRPYMTQCQKNILSALKEGAKKMVGKNGDWVKYYEENFSWLADESRGGFLHAAAKQGFTLDVDTFKPLIENLRRWDDIKSTPFYQELLKINDTMLISSTISEDYFKNRNTGLLSDPKVLNQSILGALSVEDPFKDDPALRQQCLNLYHEMRFSRQKRIHVSDDQQHNQLVDICNKVKTNAALRGKDDSSPVNTPNNRK